MKKLIVFIVMLALTSSAFCQQDPDEYAKIYQQTYQLIQDVQAFYEFTDKLHVLSVNGWVETTATGVQVQEGQDLEATLNNQWYTLFQNIQNDIDSMDQPSLEVTPPNSPKIYSVETP